MGTSHATPKINLSLFETMTTKLLADYTTLDLPADGPIVELGEDASLFEAVKLLAENSISALPIWSEKGGKYLGLLDSMDVVRFVASMISHGHINVLHIQRLIREETALKISNLAKRHPFVTVKEGSPVLDVLTLMKAGASRVPVVDSSGRLVKVISQSTILRQLGLHVNELNRDITSSSLAALKLGFKEVVGVLTTDRTTDAIKALSDHNLSAVAVFLEDHELLSNVSASDIIIAIASGFELSLPVQSFLTQIRTKYLFKKRHGKDFPASVTAHPESSVKNVIQKLAATGLHRLYVTDMKSNKPLGVVALQDIINILI